MEYRVIKFGGSSLADSQSILQVCRIIKENGDGVAVVVSAMQGMTDLLHGGVNAAAKGDLQPGEEAAEQFRRRHLEAIHELVRGEPAKARLRDQVEEYSADFLSICQSLTVLRELTDAVTARAAARGERMMAALLAATLSDREMPAQVVDAPGVILVEPGPVGMFPEPAACEAGAVAVREVLDKNSLVVMPGYIAGDANGELVLLGRGGTDFSATILGAAINAKSVTLYKEVDGILTADPAAVDNVRIVPQLHYREAAELAYYGAKVLHPFTIIPLVLKQIPLFLKNTFVPEREGTRIAGDVLAETYPVKALTSIRAQALVAVEGKGMMGVPGIAGRTFAALAARKISVSMISQASSESSICFVVPEGQSAGVRDILRQEFRFEISHGMIDDVKFKTDKSIVALVGLGMSGCRGTAARAFKAAARVDANIEAIAQGSSELNISMVMSSDKVSEVLTALHDEFRLDKLHSLPDVLGQKVSIALFGFGQIGRTLAAQLMEQSAYFREKNQVNPVVVSLVDTSGMVLEVEGFNRDQLAAQIERKATGQKLVENSNGRRSPAEILGHLKNHLWSVPFAKSIFVDMTADETGDLFLEALNQGMHVVTANKKPMAVDWDKFQLMRETARRKGLMLRYEATVGAGLPVLDTLAKLEAAGDEVYTILGCLSGTLGYLMTEVEDGTPFSEAVEKAWKEGYTEPDPREDLSGMDVARKALILARTLGTRINLDQINLEPLFPAELDDDDPAEFVQNLKALDDEMAARMKEAAAADKVLRYVARIAGEDVTVGIEAVPASSPLGRLRGTDNQVTIRTRRYDENPLIVTGPGAGAEVTASGVLNDIVAVALAHEPGASF